MENKFENAKKLIEEHKELCSLYRSLELNDDNKIGVIHTWDDSPGINYTTYSDNIKKIIMQLVDNRIKEIEQNFN